MFMGLKDAQAAHRTQIMGILNVTPDSFFDGGRFAVPERARAAAEAMIEDGADWLDVGAESSRPGAAPISAEEEWARLAPVLDGLAGLDVALSVDTYRASTAKAALARGVRMINDISALRMDPAMGEVIAEADCEVVLMHMQGTPQTMQQAPRYTDVVAELCAFFEERLGAATACGIREERIWLDPGFGFGKSVAHNLTVLRELAVFKQFGRPLLLGTSNKSTIGTVLDLPVDERMEGTAATVAIGIWNGADGVRVHDVRSMARVARMTDALKGGRHG